MSYPVALSTIGAIGLSTLVFLQWRRKTTVVSPNTLENQKIGKEASQIVKPGANNIDEVLKPSCPSTGGFPTIQTDDSDDGDGIFCPESTNGASATDSVLTGWNPAGIAVEAPVYELKLKEFKEWTPSEERLRNKWLPVLPITNGLTLEDGSAIIQDPEESVVQLFLYNYVRTPENPFGYIKWKELHSIYPGIIELRIPMNLWRSWNEFQSISLRYKGNLIKVNFQFTRLINLNGHS